MQLEDELLAVEVVDLGAGLGESELPDHAEGRLVPRADRGDEVCDAVLRDGPRE